MPFVFTWSIPNKQIEISCIAEDHDEARRKAIDVIKELEDISYEVKFLSEQRKKLIIQLHSAAEDSSASVSTFSPLTKDEIRRKIVSLNGKIEGIRSQIKANMYLGMTCLTDLKYTPDKDDEMSLVHVIIKTEPTMSEFHPVTLKRVGISL